MTKHDQSIFHQHSPENLWNITLFHGETHEISMVYGHFQWQNICVNHTLDTDGLMVPTEHRRKRFRRGAGLWHEWPSATGNEPRGRRTPAAWDVYGM